MSLVRFLRAVLRSRAAERQKRLVLRDAHSNEISREEWAESVRDPTAFYLRCFRYFHSRLASDLRAHRRYFAAERRGFGEDAFHVMWFLLFREFKPREFLEIGVYRGQTLSLAALLQRTFACEGNVAGISPFSATGDSVSRYDSSVDYLQDTLENFAQFSVRKPTLLKAFSTDKAAGELIASRQWDCVYIDGSHDYEVASQDWKNCSRQIRLGGIIVLDDSGLTTIYKPPLFASAGHPGPSQIAGEVARQSFSEILQVGHNRVFQRIA